MKKWKRLVASIITAMMCISMTVIPVSAFEEGVSPVDLQTTVGGSVSVTGTVYCYRHSASTDAYVSGYNTHAYVGAYYFGTGGVVMGYGFDNDYGDSSANAYVVASNVDLYYSVGWIGPTQMGDVIGGRAYR